MFIGNTRSMIYHTEKCHYSQMILKENHTTFEEEDIHNGFRPCSHCKPDQTHFTIRGGADL